MPRSQTSLRLNHKRQKLFDEHAYLVAMCFRKYRRWCPASLQDDLRQRIFIKLAYSAHQYDGRCPFGSYAWMRLENAAKSFLHGRCRYGSSALRDAERFELALDDVIGKNDDDGAFTLGDKVESALADHEAHPAADNYSAILHDIREAVRSLKTLTRNERRVLRLRYLEGLALDRAAGRMRISQVTAKRIQRSAIAKLRLHFADRGSLAPSAPVPRDKTPDCVHWHWAKPPKKRRSKPS